MTLAPLRPESPNHIRHLPLKKISGGNTSMTASELPRVLTVVLLRVCVGNFFCTGCSRDWLLKRFI